MRHLLITGGTGQVGRALARLNWPSGFKLHVPAREQLDLADRDSIMAYLASRDWAGVINCAAYTAVDQAERHVATVFLVNAQGPAWLAEVTGKVGIPLVHLSTDYVFDGCKASPYVEDDVTGPVGAYGASKLAGELAVRAGNSRSVIVRTAWLLAADGNNFLRTMLGLAEQDKPAHVVCDQLGSPTAVSDLAVALRTIMLRLIDDPAASTGIYNFVNAGEASWYELASTIFDCAARNGWSPPPVHPVPSTQYPTLARRPANSRLSTEKIAMDYHVSPRHWRDAVAEIVTQIAKPARSGKCEK